MAADEKPQAPVGAPGVWGKRIAVLTGLVIVALIVILFVFSPGLLPIQQGGNTSPSITPNISHPGISDADYYQGTDAIVDTVVLTVAPTQVMVKNTELYVDADKDMSKVIVTVQFNGGPGTGLVRDNRVVLTRSDGTVTEGKLNFNQRLSTVQLQGSRGTDRIQVIVYLHSGETKTIIDKLLPYRKYH